MIKKGIISNIDITNARASVIIADENEVVTPMLPLALSIDPASISVGQLCVAAIFDADYINLADGAIIAIISRSQFAVLGNHIATEGMTWREWANSKYNTKGLVIDDRGCIWDSINYLEVTVYDEEAGGYISVRADDLIIKGADYILS